VSLLPFRKEHKCPRLASESIDFRLIPPPSRSQILCNYLLTEQSQILSTPILHTSSKILSIHTILPHLLCHCFTASVKLASNTVRKSCRGSPQSYSTGLVAFPLEFGSRSRSPFIRYRSVQSASRQDPVPRTRAQIPPAERKLLTSTHNIFTTADQSSAITHHLIASCCRQESLALRLWRFILETGRTHLANLT